MSLPKIIHIVWIGDESKRPDPWIKTWKALNPGYEVRVWGNDAVRAETWILGDQINAWLGREINGAADIIRWEILFRYGGLAFDADSACVRPLEDWLIEPDCFAAWEHELLRPGLIAAGALGFVPNHFLVGHILKDIVEDPDPYGGMAWQKLGPQRITDTFRKLNFPNLTVYPSHFFFPKHHSGFEYGGKGPVFARQFWGSTHRGWGTENADAIAFDVQATHAESQLTTALSPAPMPAPHPAGIAAAPAKALIERGAANYFYLQKLTVTDVPQRLPYLRTLCKDRRVLHVGCTDFPVFDPQRNLHIQLHDICRTIDGLDTDIDGMAVLSTHVAGRYYSSASAIAECYDLVLVPETIEHVGNIQVFLQELDGIDFEEILITAPCLLGWNQCFNYRNFPGARSDLLVAPDDYFEEIHPDHKAWFTPYTLANCVEQFTTWRVDSIMFLEAKRMTAVRCSKRRATSPAGLADVRTDAMVG